LEKFVEGGFVCGRVVSGKNHRKPASEKLTRSHRPPAEQTERRNLSKVREWKKNMRTRIV
jgi:hypothetical protein